MQIYLVGGAVRDALLDLPVKERDWVVVGASPEHMQALGYQQVGKDFPVFLHPETHEEYALARTERKTAPGYHGFTCHADPDVTLEQDLERRDLTINAMAQTAEGEIVDPFNGQEDLQNGLLRHVSPAFSEDPVRILRLARFAARFAPFGFRVAHATHQLMRQMVAAGEVDALVPERVWKELSRALEEPQPERFFQVLHACGALQRLFPELVPLFAKATGHGAESAPTHPGISALRAAVAAGLSAPERFAALLHALPGEAPEQALQNLCQRFRVPTHYQTLALKTQLLHPHCVDFRHYPAEALNLLEALDAFRRGELFEQFLSVCQILPTQSGELADTLRQARAAAAAISVAPLLEQGLKGKAIGAGLRDLRLQAVQQVFASHA